jgi:integrase
MQEAKKENGEKRFSVDSHRSALIQTRTFLQWCIGKGWLKENPALGVQGIGKRRPRGKSLGKEGNELRIKQTRAWYEMALYRAHRGDEGSIAALVDLLLAMRPCEIVSRRVADVDEDEWPGDLLWIPCSKTPAGRRTLEVPVVLQPFLVRCCEGKRPDQYLFEADSGGPHWRDWVQNNVQRLCDLAEVPRVTAYYMRGQLATITSERGLAGHLLAAHLGHEDEKMAQQAYAAPGSAAKGVQRRGLAVLDGGLKKQT